MTDQEKAERQKQIEEFDKMLNKQSEIFKLIANIPDPFLNRFFDFNSDKMLDKKIEVLKKLAAGATPREVTEYYDILELYPKDSDMPWDL